MELSTRDYDDIVEIQLNIHDDTKLDLAIARLRPEVLLGLREGCLKLIDRQSDIISRVERRLAED
jgi:hypothetical protein